MFGSQWLAVWVSEAHLWRPTFVLPTEMKVWSLFLKNSTSLEETDTKSVTAHCHKNSEMRAGDVKKGGICSWSCRLDRGVFADGKGKASWGTSCTKAGGDSRYQVAHTFVLQVKSGPKQTFGCWVLFAFPEIKQTNQVTGKRWVGVTPVLTYKSLWPLTQHKVFWSTFWEVFNCLPLSQLSWCRKTQVCV